VLNVSLSPLEKRCWIVGERESITPLSLLLISLLLFRKGIEKKEGRKRKKLTGPKGKERRKTRSASLLLREKAPASAPSTLEKREGKGEKKEY